MRLSLAIIALGAFAASDIAAAQSVVQKLAGNSMEAQVVYGLQFRHPSGRVVNGNTTIALRVYFSQKGRIFNYARRTTGTGDESRRQVVTPGQTVTDPAFGLKATWFADANSLTRTYDFGSLRQLMRVNVSGTSCDILFVFEKKPGHAKHIIPDLRTKEPLEYLDHSLQSKTCRIQPGNIFAPGDV